MKTQHFIAFLLFSFIPFTLFSQIELLSTKRYNLGYGWGAVYDMVQQGDKTIAVGYVIDNGIKRIYVTRHDKEGKLDSTFATNGTYIHTLAVEVDAEAHSVDIQSDGKIVIGGWIITDHNTYMLVLRLTEDGQTDTSVYDSIYEAGVQVYTYGDQVNDLVVQPDDKIVLVGKVQSEFGALRLLPDLAPDPAFGVDGWAILPIGSTSVAKAVTLYPTSPYNIIIAGDANFPDSQRDIIMVRLLENGTINPDFNSGTFKVFSKAGQQEACTVEKMDNNNLIIGGSPDEDFCLIKTSYYGEIFTGFGTQGFAIQDVTFFGYKDVATCMAVKSDRIYLGGYTNNAGNSELVYRTFSPNNGHPTNLFFYSPFNLHGGDVYGQCMLVHNDGKVLMGGHWDSRECGKIGSRPLLTRFTASGITDPSYNSTGYVLEEAGQSSDVGFDVANQGNKYLHVGTVNDRIVLFRTDNEGHIDPAFGLDGYVEIEDATINPGISDKVNMIVLPTGQIVVGATKWNCAADYNFLTVVLDANGVELSRIEEDFGASGIGKIAYDGALQRIYAIGNANFSKPCVVAYNLNCQPVLAFNGTGQLVFSGMFGGGYSETYCATMVGQNLLIAGHHADYTIGEPNFYVAMIQPNGSLVNNFGSMGITLIDIPGYKQITIRAMAMQGNKIVIAGSARIDDMHKADFFVARLKANGDLDNSFHDTGYTIFDYGDDADDAAKALLCDENDIFIAGSSDHDFVVVRLSPNGVVADKIRTDFDFASGSDGAYTIIAVAPCQIMVTGRSRGDAAVARYDVSPGGCIVPTAEIAEFAPNFELGQNYPNPVESSTLIPFNLTESAAATLEVFDMTGRKVVTVFQENMAAGEHQIAFSPAQYACPSGMYLYTLSSGQYRVSQKMTVLR